MANFTPLNNYAIFILDKLIKKYDLRPPFLDVACGTGYLSAHMGDLGWWGNAIDYSRQAVEIAKSNLKRYQNITVERTSLLKTNGRYKTVLMFDVLEHIKDDISALKKVFSLLEKDGHLIIAGPSNPKEWRWDDEFYGHYRRYTEAELRKKLIEAELKPMVFYDYTFPIFWLLRRIYTKLKNKKRFLEDTEKRTKKSSFVYAWDMSLISIIMNNASFLWSPIYIFQYFLFRKKTNYGSSILVLAKKGKL